MINWYWRIISASFLGVFLPPIGLISVNSALNPNSCWELAEHCKLTICGRCWNGRCLQNNEHMFAIWVWLLILLSPTRVNASVSTCLRVVCVLLQAEHLCDSTVVCCVCVCVCRCPVCSHMAFSSLMVSPALCVFAGSSQISCRVFKCTGQHGFPLLFQPSHASTTENFCLSRGNYSTHPKPS